MKIKKHRADFPLLYLASQSPRRKEILKRMGLRFRVVPSKYHEKKIPGLSVTELILAHALGKARAARLPKRKGIVLGSDTVVYRRGRILGKPGSKKEAVEMLRFLSDREHSVYTGVVLYCPETRKTLVKYDRTRVYFKKLTPQDIERYLQDVHVLDKAGSYAIQEGRRIVKKIKGSYSNVVGLPSELLSRMLLDWQKKVDKKGCRRKGQKIQ